MNLKRPKGIVKQKTKKEIKAIADQIVNQLDEYKALDIQLLDVSDKTDVCHYMVVASGTSNRHVSAVSERLTQFIKHDIDDVDYRVEGEAEGYWVLIDCYDIVIHLFQKEAREYYDIEKIWDNITVDQE